MPRYLYSLHVCVAVCVSGLVAFVSSPTVAADIRPRVEAVRGVPGGIAAIPLQREPGTLWPARVAVRIGELQSQAAVVWVGRAVFTGARSWTRSPLQVNASMAADMATTPEPEGIGEVFAMVELPASGEGSIEIGTVEVKVHWLPLPQRIRADAPVLAVASTVTDDRPDPGTPMDYWRWALIAERQGARIGDPRGNTADRLWARHLASIWAGALERARQASRGIHDEIVDLLTATVDDVECKRQIAAWIARPSELQSLLGLLLDHDRTDMDAAQSALTWMRDRWTCTLWIEQDASDRVRVAVANPTAEERVLQVTWSGSAGESLPTAVVAVPRRVTRVWIDRPALQPTTEQFETVRMRSEVLEVSDGNSHIRLTVGAREYPVQPPGLGFGVFLPPLSLVDAQANAIVPPATDWQTSASLRRREGRWELFIEAFRPADAVEPHNDEVIVRIGNPTDPTQVFAISADGQLEMRVGADDGVSAGFMAWKDRWRARVELPDQWIPSAGAGVRPLQLAVERTPGPMQARQTAGLARPAWVVPAPPILLDLGAWDDFGR